MRTIKTLLVALAATLVLAAAAAAATHTISVTGTANLPRIWGCEFFYTVQPNFSLDSIPTQGSACPASWGSVPVIAAVNGTQLHIVVTQDIINHRTDYLGDGTIVSFNYTGTIVGLSSQTIIGVVDAAGNDTDRNIYPGLIKGTVTPTTTVMKATGRMPPIYLLLL